jgi:hypothetical protein
MIGEENTGGNGPWRAALVQRRSGSDRGEEPRGGQRRAQGCVAPRVEAFQGGHRILRVFRFDGDPFGRAAARKLSSAAIARPGHRGRRVRRSGPAAAGEMPGSTYCCLTMSTEISTAGIVPLFSSQCVVFLSSGQPTPGPYSVATPFRWSVIVPCRT